MPRWPTAPRVRDDRYRVVLMERVTPSEFAEICTRLKEIAFLGGKDGLKATELLFKYLIPVESDMDMGDYERRRVIEMSKEFELKLIEERDAFERSRRQRIESGDGVDAGDGRALP